MIAVMCLRNFSSFGRAALLLSLFAALSACQRRGVPSEHSLEPVDCVNPYMGNISHLLVPTFPTVHLPNGMMRIYPERRDHTVETLAGLPLIVTNHRERSAFRLSPLSSHPDSVGRFVTYEYDQEQIKPYYYRVLLDEPDIEVEFAPAYQSAIYRLSFAKDAQRQIILLSSLDGELEATGRSISGYQTLEGKTRVYLHMQYDRKPLRVGVRDEQTGRIVFGGHERIGKTVALEFPTDTRRLHLRYGVSLISAQQAKANLSKEIQTNELDMVAKHGRHEWSKHLGRIKVEGGTAEDRKVFYTSLYRTYERMINISEDGRYYSAIDGQIHNDEGIPFYTDDWIWDTYRAVHPLRVLIDPLKQQHMLASFVRMAEQNPEGWLPTFPEVTGDTHRMNGNHGIATFADAYAKGLTGFNLVSAYQAAKKTMAEKSFLPWTRIPKGPLSKYMDEHGYFPALRIGERETDPRVTLWEKRQAVAVTLAAAYDYWTLSQMARFVGKDAEAQEYLRKSYDYRTLFNYKTGFFHPKDDKGRFIQPFDYELSGGLGARDYYDENNAYTYRWDVQHNPADLIYLMGGREQFIKYLDETFRTPLSKSKWEFYSQLPDQSGNVGQFSMANEPSLHIPYLYNYAGAPWKTQRSIRKLISSWFRNDLMGVPGDEDGGGLSAFVVFSMMGIYPVTPGLPVYNIGTPFFERVTMQLDGGRLFTIEAPKASATNKYIQSAKLNGKALDRAWLKHSELIEGGTLELQMGPRPNKLWGANTPPPSADPLPDQERRK